MNKSVAKIMGVSIVTTTILSSVLSNNIYAKGVEYRKDNQTYYITNDYKKYIDDELVTKRIEGIELKNITKSLGVQKIEVYKEGEYNNSFSEIEVLEASEIELKSLEDDVDYQISMGVLEDGVFYPSGLYLLPTGDVEFALVSDEDVAQGNYTPSKKVVKENVKTSYSNIKKVEEQVEAENKGYWTYSIPRVVLKGSHVKVSEKSKNYYLLLESYNNSTNEINELAVIYVPGKVDKNIEGIKRPKQFTDVKEKDWFYNSVSKASKMNAVKGYDDGSFKPNKNITIGEVLAIYYNLDTVIDFEGAEEGFHWASKYYDSHIAGGIINEVDMPRTKATLDRPATREEAVKILSELVRVEPKDKVEFKIKDQDKIAKNKLQSILYLYEIGVLEGSGGEFKPKDSITRAEVATIAMKMVKNNIDNWDN